ncbi:endonuclease [Polaribacter aestuariivivens]|uniref:Endonuclease n=1 Tax=Polaribacter aestuariivivens TaxID=2304626 RepID=A0A5S3NCJ2_9FLAO|nr:endonuclease/exonuclease/phosphatase family protein [Polaribacter aestuariivivens]TMM31399.1 endonuclease [Polaribacter aestuariivivens]
MKNLSFLDKIFYLLNSLLATLLLLSYLLPYISPNTMPILAVLSLFVPILAIINICFVIYWLIKLKKQFFLSTVVLLIGWFFSSTFYKFSDKNSSLNSDLKVMSYNVKAFDFFNVNTDSTSTKNGFDFIADKNPDVLAIQEYYQSSKIKLSYPYKFIKTKNDKGKFGMAIYSKYKIINSGSLNLKNTSNNIIFIDILKETDTIRVYNFHLESLRIKPNEENFGEENSEKLLNRVSTSFKMQTQQALQFLEHEKNWHGKRIICGDFNNTAYSWVYKKISMNKKDAFLEAGKGFGKTFNYWFPMRIDFILVDEKAIVNQFKVFSEQYSDHFPVQAKISWK